MIFEIEECRDEKNHLNWIIWGIIIVYGLFIYPRPEQFPMLTNRGVSFVVMLLGVGNLFLGEDKKE